MESYLKKFMRELLEHKNNLNEYVDELYADDTREDDLNALFGALKKEGLLSCIYADNRAYDVQLTLKGKNLPASELKLSDKEELLLLISSIDDIEKLFHKNEGKRDLGEWIHDVPEFQDWLQQVTFYLQKIQDKKYSQYILETINEGRNWGGITDRLVFNKFAGRLKSIAKNINLYYEDEEDVDIKEKKVQTQPRLRFMKLKTDHISYVVQSLNNNTTHIVNMRNYMLTALYNSYGTMEQSWISRIRHDMYGEKYERDKRVGYA